MRPHWRTVSLFLLLPLASAGPLAAQSTDTRDLAPGKILVAPPDQADPTFGQSVILLVQYDSKGALGLMVNRKTTLPVSAALKGLAGAEKVSAPVFVGGPVELDTVFALARGSHKPDGSSQVLRDLYFLAAKTALEKAVGDASDPTKLRIYVGYCGWGPGQLDGEVRMGGWYIFNGSAAMAFDDKPASLWPRLMARPTQQVARLSFSPRIP